MAKDPETVQGFYDELLPALIEKGRQEIEVMGRLLAGDTADASAELQVWDWRFYDTQLRKLDYGVDNNEVAAYFPLEQVIDGLLAVTGEVFGLEYPRVPDASVWHPDVVTYAIHDADSGEELARFHMDPHPRDGKFSHAAAFDLVPGRRLPDGSYRQPVSAIVANLTKPTADRPSLLQHNEAVTLFHEFGHVLHQTLTQAELARFSGTNTERDFVEAPSQIMEHWTWNASVLARFARHHETGEPIPEVLVSKLVAARDLNVGLSTLRQIQFGVLDMDLHGPDDDKDIDAIHPWAGPTGARSSRRAARSTRTRCCATSSAASRTTGRSSASSASPPPTAPSRMSGGLFSFLGTIHRTFAHIHRDSTVRSSTGVTPGGATSARP